MDPFLKQKKNNSKPMYVYGSEIIITSIIPQGLPQFMISFLNSLIAYREWKTLSIS